MLKFFDLISQGIETSVSKVSGTNLRPNKKPSSNLNLKYYPACVVCVILQLNIIFRSDYSADYFLSENYNNWPPEFLEPMREKRKAANDHI